MRRSIALGLGLLLALAAARALAVPGVDPDPEPVTIVFEPFSSSDPLFFRLEIPTTLEGGDRQKYDCAFVELAGTDGTSIDAIITAERTGLLQSSGQQYVGVNDRGISELSDGHSPGPGAVETGDLCGEPDTTTTDEKGRPVNVKGLAVFDGTDHFPHVIHEGDRLDLYRDGLVAASIPVATTECDPAYFVPGDEPGELWLWWDEDGPTNAHGHGEPTGELDCGGGPLEPIVLARLYVDFMAPGIGVCTETFHERSCAGLTEPAPPSPSPSPCRVNPKTGACRPPKG